MFLDGHDLVVWKWVLTAAGLGLRADVPGQKFPDPVDRMFGDRRQDRTQIEGRIDSIQFSGGDETVEGRCAFTT